MSEHINETVETTDEFYYAVSVTNKGETTFAGKFEFVLDAIHFFDNLRDAGVEELGVKIEVARIEIENTVTTRTTTNIETVRS